MIDAVIEKSRSLRLKHCSENIAAIIEQAAQHNHSHLQAIDRLLDIEIEAREQSRIILRFKQSKFTEKSTIDQHENVAL